MGHGRSEANKPSTDSKREATGDNYPAHGSIVRRSLVSILGIQEIPFPGKIEKKDRDSRKQTVTAFLITILANVD